MSDFRNRRDITGELAAHSKLAYDIERISGALGGRFSDLKPLGADGVSEFYLARENSHGGLVKIKVLSPITARDLRRRELFHVENHVASRLSHMNIESGGSPEEIDGIHFCVVEYKQEAETLRDLINRSGWLDLRRAIEIADQIASALDYAHDVGVLHLKLQPESVLVEPDGWVSVTGFGIEAEAELAWVQELRSRETGAPYISPEQMRGATADHRADLYSLGVILYEMLTDRLPFDSDDENYVRHRQMSYTPAPPHLIFMDVPETVSNIVMKLLDRNPDGRFDSAAALQLALDHALNPDAKAIR